jgi:radical SAM protein with 4Fe4S-binding SPASM domain
LRAHGVPVVGCVVVTHKNAAVVGDVLALWDGLGVRDVALSRFSPAGYAARHAAALLPTLSDLRAAFSAAAAFARRSGMRISCTMPLPPCVLDPAEFAPVSFGHCPIGTDLQEFALGPAGELRHCTLHGRALGGVADVLADDVDLMALVGGTDVTEYRRHRPAFCRGCVHEATCGGGCGAAAAWMTGEEGAHPIRSCSSTPTKASAGTSLNGGATARRTSSSSCDPDGERHERRRREDDEARALRRSGSGARDDPAAAQPVRRGGARRLVHLAFVARGELAIARACGLRRRREHPRERLDGA